MAIFAVLLPTRQPALEDALKSVFPNDYLFINDTDLSESGRIIRGFESRSAYGTLFLPKLCPLSRRALFFDDDTGTANVRFVRGIVKSLK